MVKFKLLFVFVPVAGCFRRNYALATGQFLVRLSSNCELIRHSDGYHDIMLPHGGKPFRIEFDQKRAMFPKKELIYRAIGKSKTVVDLTAGLGRDAFILASAGCDVHLVERNEVLFRLLWEAVERLRSVNCSLVDRLHLTLASAETVDLMTVLMSTSHDDGVSVILDPMYDDGKFGRKAMVKKETQVLRALCETDKSEENNVALFDAARRWATKRIVVKRPVAAPPLLQRRPHSAITGSRHRFDIYFVNQLAQ